MTAGSAGFKVKEEKDVREPFSVHAPLDQPVEMTAGERRAWWRAIGAFLVTFVVLLAAIAVLNYVVNPLGVFPTKVLPPMVWNGRGEKVDALASEEPKPQILVFGSSHVWALSPEVLTRLTGKPAFNVGVSVAMPEDDYALLRYAVEQAHVHPALVLVGLDAEALHNNRPVDQRTQKVWELRQYLPPMSVGQRLAQWKPLITMESTTQSVRSLALHLRGRSERPPDPLYTVTAHGDTHLSLLEHQLAVGTTTREIEVVRNFDTFGRRWDGYTGLSAERAAYLDRMLKFCREQHIEAVVYLTPLDPALGASLENKGYTARRAELAAKVRGIAKADGAQFFDHTDPASFGATAADFLDGAHMTHAGGAKLAAVLLKEAHALQ